MIKEKKFRKKTQNTRMKSRYLKRSRTIKKSEWIKV